MKGCHEGTVVEVLAVAGVFVPVYVICVVSVLCLVYALVRIFGVPERGDAREEGE